MFTKSGIMVGLGEERNEVLQLMDDLRSADVDFLTIGQYLQPTRKHHPVIRFVPPDEFSALRDHRRAKGFLMVSASPLTRSSHHAGEDFAALQGGAPARQACLMLSSSSGTCRISPDRMFDLVNDLEDYPRFLPNVQDMQVKRDDGAEGDVRFAKMTIQFGPISQAYTSRVVAEPRRAQRSPPRPIDGPFSLSRQQMDASSPRATGTRDALRHRLQDCQPADRGGRGAGVCRQAGRRSWMRSSKRRIGGSGSSRPKV